LYDHGRLLPIPKAPNLTLSFREVAAKQHLKWTKYIESQRTKVDNSQQGTIQMVNE
jgi:hypothetical protein